MEKERRNIQRSAEDSAEVGREIRPDVEGVMAARAIELASSAPDLLEESPDRPRSLLSLDPEFAPILHPDGRVEAKLSDGRRINLMTRSFGHDDGWPIIFCPGLPASGMPKVPYRRNRDLYLSGLRLIMWDRPGYGDSDRWKGHRVGDGAVLMQAIARAYGINQYSVAGRSGGAPYALGAGALCSEAVNVAVFGCRAPSNVDIDRRSGASSVNEMLLNVADEVMLAQSFRDTSGAAIIERPSAVLESIIPHLSPADLRVVYEPEVYRYLTASHMNGLKNKADGRVDNILALRAHWCFELADLGDKLTYVVQGSADDSFTTTAHFDYLLDNIANAVPIERPDMGHMGTIALEMPIFRALAQDALGR